MSKYMHVYKDIKQKIEENIWQENQELPTENELMEYYSYSKDTIRKALSMLAIDGYIEKRQGRNSIILNHHLVNKQFLSEIKTVSELNRSALHDIETKLVALYIVQGEEDLMETFDVTAEMDFYRVARIRSIDGQRLEYELSYFDRRVVPYLNQDIVEASIYNHLENHLHLKISHSRREITFRHANDEERQYMDLGDYDMVVVVSSTTYLDDGQPFQYGSISYRPDQVTFVSMAKR
ncbi:GntR family transcriptional regulator [Streptococcus rifensis]